MSEPTACVEGFCTARFEPLRHLFRELIEAPTFPEFLTLPAYDMITAEGC